MTDLTTTETGTLAVTATAGELARTLRIAVAFVEPDGFGGTESVYLEAGNQILTATATDRHTLGHIRQTAVGDWAGRGAVIRHDRVRLLIRALRLLHHEDPVSLTLAHSGKKLRLAHPDLVLLLPTEGTSPGQREWVDYRKLFSKFDAGTPGLAGPISLDPALAEPFATARRILPTPWGDNGPPVRWTILDATSPVRIEIGDAFTGLIMPRRFDSASAKLWPVPVGHTREDRHAH